MKRRNCLIGGIIAVTLLLVSVFFAVTRPKDLSQPIPEEVVEGVKTTPTLTPALFVEEPEEVPAEEIEEIVVTLTPETFPPAPVRYQFQIIVTASTVGRGMWKIDGNVVTTTDVVSFPSSREARDAMVRSLDLVRQLCPYSGTRNSQSAHYVYGSKPSEECLLALEKLGGSPILRDGQLSDEAWSQIRRYAVERLEKGFYDIYTLGGRYITSIFSHQVVYLSNPCWTKTARYYGYKATEVRVIDANLEGGGPTLYQYAAGNADRLDSGWSNFCENHYAEADLVPEWVTYTNPSEGLYVVSVMTSTSEPEPSLLVFEYHTISTTVSAWDIPWTEGRHRVVQIVNGEPDQYMYDVAPGHLIHLNRNIFVAAWKYYEIFLAFDEAGEPHWYTHVGISQNSVGMYASTVCDRGVPCLHPTNMPQSEKAPQPYMIEGQPGQPPRIVEQTAALWWSNGPAWWEE